MPAATPPEEGTPTPPIESVIVVGGGDAGLMAALILHQLHPDLDITIIDDFERPIPEVGKSTISYILYTFHDFLEIDKTRFVSEVKPIWKASVFFKDWCGKGPFHVPFDGFTLQPNQPSPQRFEVLYARYRDMNYHSLGTEIAETGVTPFAREQAGLTQYDHVAYHLGTDRLNTFLRDLATERGISLVDDEITQVDGDGDWITGIASDTTTYDAGLYVDASGFARVLMGRLDNTFNPYDFPLDSAVVATTDLSLADIEPATVIHSGEYGWFWQIDTYDCRDLGYVYASEYVSDEDAVHEFIARHDHAFTEDDINHYRYQAGAYEDAWVGNCVAVGNALGFVEPLQSTALTVNAQLCEKLSELLADHGRHNHPGTRDIYNACSQSIWDNVYDFVSIHYRYAAGDNDLWTAMQSVNTPDRLAKYLDPYHANGFNSYDDYENVEGPPLNVFNYYLFYQLLRSLGVRSDFYEHRDIAVSPEVEDLISNQDDNITKRARLHLSYEDFYKKELPA